MVTPHQSLAPSTVGTVRARRTACAVVTTDEPIALLAERAPAARDATTTFHTVLVRARSQRSAQSPKPRLEFCSGETIHTKRLERKIENALIAQEAWAGGYAALIWRRK